MNKFIDVSEMKIFLGAFWHTQYVHEEILRDFFFFDCV